MKKDPSKVTNPLLTPNGFGENLQHIIYAIIEAEFTHKEFVYTPMVYCANCPTSEDLELRETILNFKSHYPINNDPEWQKLHQVSFRSIKNFDSSYMNLCAKSQTIQTLKMLFKKNKNKEKYFDKNAFNIAIHIRRHNKNDNPSCLHISNKIYLQIIKLLRSYYPDDKVLFHIYSEGDVNLFKKDFAQKDVILHVDELDIDSFSAMGFADVLVVATSSFSYCAGLVSDGDIYYFPCWYSVFPSWKALNVNGFPKLVMHDRDVGTWFDWNSAENRAFASRSQLFQI